MYVFVSVGRHRECVGGDARHHYHHPHSKVTPAPRTLVWCAVYARACSPLAAPPAPAPTLCSHAELRHYADEWQHQFQPRLSLRGHSLGLEVTCAELVMALAPAGGDPTSTTNTTTTNAPLEGPLVAHGSHMALQDAGGGGDYEAGVEGPEEGVAQQGDMQELWALDGEPSWLLHPQSQAWGEVGAPCGDAPLSGGRCLLSHIHVYMFT